MATAVETTRGPLSRLAFGRPVVTPRPEYYVAQRPTAAMIARFAISAVFIVAGISKLFLDTEGTAGYMRSAGIPYAYPLAILAGIVELVGGLMIATGTLARIGALMLIGFLIVVQPIFHDFWNVVGQERTMQQIQFLKDLAIMGGLLLIFADGPGRYAVDSKIHRRHIPRERA